MSVLCTGVLLISEKKQTQYTNGPARLQAVRMNERKQTKMTISCVISCIENSREHELQ
jgi:hypothetical protein